MRPQPRIDVSALPTMAYGPRSTLWWGVVSMLAIETTMFALLFATYFYLRGNESIWPPGGGSHGNPPVGPATAGLFLLLLSVLPMVLAASVLTATVARAHRIDAFEARVRRSQPWRATTLGGPLPGA